MYGLFTCMELIQLPVVPLVLKFDIKDWKGERAG
jgi:hypothetical protein